MDFLTEPLNTHIVHFNYPVKRKKITMTSVTLEGLDLRGAPARSHTCSVCPLHSRHS